MREDIIIQIRRILPFTVCVLAVIVVCDISTTAYAEKWSSVTLVASMVHLLAWRGRRAHLSMLQWWQ